jgi:peptidoglycan/LPS O-acetylase OafA/YrhL
MTLDAHAKGRDNNFDVVRLAAAAVVLVSHAFLVTGTPEPRVGHWTLGALGVEIFFAISGFLVARSWAGQPRLRAFVVKRGLRIVPALALTVIVSAFILGPLVTTRSVDAYVQAPATFAYPVDNVVAAVSGGSVRKIDLTLPGVFAGNPDTAVNKSLWTLPIEVQAYMAIAVLGLVGLFTRGLLAAAIGFFALSLLPGLTTLPLVGAPLEFVRGADGEAAHLLALFAVAGLMYVHRRRIPLRPGYAVAALVALVASLGTPLERVALVLALPYLVLYLALRSWSGLRVLTRRGDVSYGLYLLAFPVSQVIVLAWPGGPPSPFVVVLVALPVTYLLAFASWHLLEKRALLLKGGLAGPRSSASIARAPDPITAQAPDPITAHAPDPEIGAKGLAATGRSVS